MILLKLLISKYYKIVGGRNMNIHERMIKLFEQVGIDITEKDYYKNIDSIVYISLIVSIENEFNIEIPEDMLNKNIIENYSYLEEYIETRF